MVGRNYAYQMIGGIKLFFDKDKHFNPFAAAGSTSTLIDDFNAENFDHSQVGFVGGATISAAITGGRPIQQLGIPKDAPRWGAAWKQAAKDNYMHSMSVESSGSVMPYRQCYLDLDPTYRDIYGQPMLRMTFDWQPNELRMTNFIKDKAEEIVKIINPKSYEMAFKPMGSHYDVRPYQSTHNTGGAVMGDDPRTSVVNKYLQCWDVPNVFVLGASCFPQNLAYNPTGIVCATTLFAADAIRNTYLANPGPLVHVQQGVSS